MPNLREPVTANIVQILDWYERPELILLEGPKFAYTLAVRSANLEDGPNVYVGGSMTIGRLRAYANGKCDLRYAIAHANLRKFWRFELEQGVSSVILNPIKRSDPDLVASIPSPGLFAREHEDIEMAKSHVPNTIERFEVDGGWDLGEFSQFYGQIEDIYYITADLNRFDDPNISPAEKSIITSAFDRSWAGGGSYVAFYRKVANDNDFHAPLRVSGIKYNSPGYVTIHARTEPFQQLMNILQSYSFQETEFRKAVNELGRFMSRSGMNRSGISSSLLLPDQKEGLLKKANQLSEFLPGVEFSTLLAMTNGNILVAAKVLVSIYKRVERLYAFFDQGRVTHKNLDVR
jgi:hypothetical protein